MPAGEFWQWVAFCNKYGSLHPELRGDRRIAMLCLTVAQLAGVKGLDLHDFLPFETRPAPTLPDLDHAIKQWS